jgi:hypothetical protein
MHRCMQRYGMAMLSKLFVIALLLVGLLLLAS